MCVFAAEEQLHYNFICVPWNLFMCLKSLSQVSSDFIPLNALICLLWIPYNITPTDALAEVEVCVWQELMDPSWIWEMCRLEPYPASPPLIWRAIMQWEYAGEIVKLREGTESKWCCKHLERDLKTTIHKLSSWHLKQKKVWKSLSSECCLRKKDVVFRNCREGKPSYFEHGQLCWGKRSSYFLWSSLWIKTSTEVLGISVEIQMCLIAVQIWWSFLNEALCLYQIGIE